VTWLFISSNGGVATNRAGIYSSEMGLAGHFHAELVIFSGFH